MSRNKRIIAAFVLVLGIVLMFVSCGGEKYTAEEIRAALDELIPASAELNEIYFGEGLPIARDEEELLELYGELDSDIEMINYAPVSPDAAYHTEEELKAATRAVFSEDYSEFLFTRGFVGITSTTTDENGEIVMAQNAIYARYIETDGILTRQIGMEDVMKLGREYDLDRMEIVSQKSDNVVVDIPTSVDGEADVTVRIKLVMTDGGWRLDSPTY